MDHMSASFMFVLVFFSVLILLCRSPPFANSITMQSVLVACSKKASL